MGAASSLQVFLDREWEDREFVEDRDLGDEDTGANSGPNDPLFFP